MDPWHLIKDEFADQPMTISFSRVGSAGTLFPQPRPMEGLNELGPPPFLNKTYEMVDDEATNEILCWSINGHSFVVWNPHAFSNTLLPRYFKHSNFSSFVRQLNTYGFRKIDPDKWEFANEEFLRGQKHLLKNIRRRRASSAPNQAFPSQQGSPDECVEAGIFGVEGEVDRLKRDKQVLMTELMKMRQQQQTTRGYLQSMEHRLQNAEQKQQQMMNFLARAMQNPAFLQQLAQQNGRRFLVEAITRKIGFGGNCNGGESSSEMTDYGGYEVSELEALAMEIQGIGRVGKEVQDDGFAEEGYDGDKELDEEFWDELFGERLNIDAGRI